MDQKPCTEQSQRALKALVFKAFGFVQYALYISGCSNGIDFDLIHEENRIVIKTADGRSFSANFSEYKTAVLSYAEQIEAFMRHAPAKIFDDPFDKEGYEAFKTEWFSLKERITAPDQPE